MNKNLREKKKAAVNLESTIRMGKSGVTQALIDEIIAQIKKKDAVKVKLLGTKREETKIIAGQLAERCNADLVDVRGNTVVLWKK